VRQLSYRTIISTTACKDYKSGTKNHEVCNQFHRFIVFISDAKVNKKDDNSQKLYARIWAFFPNECVKINKNAFLLCIVLAYSYL